MAWIATVLPSVKVHPDPATAVEFVVATSRELLAAQVAAQAGAGVILFPAGWISIAEEPRSRYAEIERRVTPLFAESAEESVVCLGIDGTQHFKDQVGMAISREGIIALGRKFYRTTKEKADGIVRAEDSRSLEDGKPRTFHVGGKTFFMLVCYDVYGVKYANLRNPGVDAQLCFIHGFTPYGKQGSGVAYFARNGLAGASRQWQCRSFASATFYDRAVPNAWPSGVLWTRGDASVKTWKYADNPLQPETRRVNGAVVRVFAFE